MELDDSSIIESNDLYDCMKSKTDSLYSLKIKQLTEFDVSEIKKLFQIVN
jgi:hypothetical protein